MKPCVCWTHDQADFYCDNETRRPAGANANVTLSSLPVRLTEEVTGTLSLYVRMLCSVCVQHHLTEGGKERKPESR